jgi:glycosyltransferase involved in cell wall biosynthesis
MQIFTNFGFIQIYRVGKEKSKLILFTTDYPFGFLEPFLETEIHNLSEGFDEVVIVTTSVSEIQTRKIPDNCKVERLNLMLNSMQKMLSLSNSFNTIFLSELAIIRNVYNLPISKGIIFTMLISLSRAKKVRKKVELIFKNKDNNENLFFYSYWCDDVALGLAMAQVEFPKIKTLCRIHRWDVYFEESAVNYLPYRHTIAQQIGKIVSISQDGIDYAKAVWKTGLDDKFVLSRLGINNSVTPAIIERNFCLLVSCSNIIPVKRVQLIAEALQEISETAIKWVHFGDGSERKALETLITNLPSNIQVELMGRRDNKEIYSYYTEHRPDLFINVSSSEGVPVSIMEAMSFGIPVIATNVGGNGEIVNNENGFLLEKNTSSSVIADVLRKFCVLSNNERQVLSKKSLQTWNNDYNARKNYLEFTDLISEL